MNMLAKLKDTIISILLRILKHDHIRLALAQQLAESRQSLKQVENLQTPYLLASTERKQKVNVSERDDIVFITGRFRSGSTLVWNMFRQIPTVTSYYEPLNERKWFLQQDRGSNVDSTHLGVENYWREFNGLGALDEIYDENWTRAHLFMDPASWNPKLKQYINHLISAASGRPVLQFNRVDFRLPWLLHHFPNAKFLHVFRHPRDQWISFLSDSSVTKEEITTSYKDNFYLHSWCQDLAAQFPFLNDNFTPHPYQRFYYLWKLSYLYGVKYSNLSISFEDLVTHKEQTTRSIIDTFGLNTSSDIMTSVIASPKLNRWEVWAEENWFSSLETECEENLDLFLQTESAD